MCAWCVNQNPENNIQRGPSTKYQGEINGFCSNACQYSWEIQMGSIHSRMMN